jgi:hypothetical protein
MKAKSLPILLVCGLLASCNKQESNYSSVFMEGVKILHESTCHELPASNKILLTRSKGNLNLKINATLSCKNLATPWLSLPMNEAVSLVLSTNQKFRLFNDKCECPKELSMELSEKRLSNIKTIYITFDGEVLTALPIE